MKRILIIDDSATDRAHLLNILKETFECFTANNGKEGLAQVKLHKPDVVLVDLEMPEMDGLTFLATMKASAVSQQIPILITTTVTAVEQVNQSRAMGCAGFVLKPIQKEYLLAKLNNLIDAA